MKVTDKLRQAIKELVKHSSAYAVHKNSSSGRDNNYLYVQQQKIDSAQAEINRLITVTDKSSTT